MATSSKIAPAGKPSGRFASGRRRVADFWLREAGQDEQRDFRLARKVMQALADLHRHHKEYRRCEWQVVEYRRGTYESLCRVVGTVSRRVKWRSRFRIDLDTKARYRRARWWRSHHRLMVDRIRWEYGCGEPAEIKARHRQYVLKELYAQFNSLDYNPEKEPIMATVKYSTGKKPQNATGKGTTAKYSTGKKPSMAQQKAK